MWFIILFAMTLLCPDISIWNSCCHWQIALLSLFYTNNMSQICPHFILHWQCIFFYDVLYFSAIPAVFSELNLKSQSITGIECSVLHFQVYTCNRFSHIEVGLIIVSLCFLYFVPFLLTGKEQNIVFFYCFNCHIWSISLVLVSLFIISVSRTLLGTSTLFFRTSSRNQ